MKVILWAQTVTSIQAYQLGVGNEYLSPLHGEILTGFRCCKGNHSCWKIICTIVMSCLVNRTSRHSPAFSSSKVLIPLPQCSHSLEKEMGSRLLKMSCQHLNIQSFILHTLNSMSLCVTTAHCNKKFRSLRLRTVQICGSHHTYSQGSLTVWPLRKLSLFLPAFFMAYNPLDMAFDHDQE